MPYETIGLELIRDYLATKNDQDTLGIPFDCGHCLVAEAVLALKSLPVPSVRVGSCGVSSQDMSDPFGIKEYYAIMTIDLQQLVSRFDSFFFFRSRFAMDSPQSVKKVEFWAWLQAYEPYYLDPLGLPNLSAV